MTQSWDIGLTNTVTNDVDGSLSIVVDATESELNEVRNVVGLVELRSSVT
jgi:acylphosphatase